MAAWFWNACSARVFLPQNLICSECGDEFTLQSQLAIHMEEHRQELAKNRVHTCKACGREFTTSAQLKEHTKTHYKVRCTPALGLRVACCCDAGCHWLLSKQEHSCHLVPGWPL